MHSRFSAALAVVTLTSGLSSTSFAVPPLVRNVVPPAPTHAPVTRIPDRFTVLTHDDLFYGLGVGLGGTNIQITNTDAGVTLPNGARSFIQFGDVLHQQGVMDRTLNVPIYEVGVGNWGAAIAAISGYTLVVDRVRFLVNDIHATLDLNSIDVSLEDEGAVVLDVALASASPTLKGEGNAYVTLFGIPVGWQDDACPDVNITNMKARIRLYPVVGSDGKIALSQIGAQILGDVDISPLDHSHDQDIRDAFGSRVADALNTADLRAALAAGLQALLERKAGGTITKLDSVSVAADGFYAAYP